MTDRADATTMSQDLMAQSLLDVHERLAGLTEAQVRNLGHVMEREQSNARFHDDQRTDLRDVAARAAIDWVMGLLASDAPAEYRSDPRTYAQYRQDAQRRRQDAGAASNPAHPTDAQETT